MCACARWSARDGRAGTRRGRCSLSCTVRCDRWSQKNRIPSCTRCHSCPYRIAFCPRSSDRKPMHMARPPRMPAPLPDVPTRADPHPIFALGPTRELWCPSEAEGRPPAQMGRGNPRVGERVAAGGGARAAQRTALDAYMQCTDPTGSIRAALGMCSASALEGMGAAAAAAAAATLEYCVSSTQRARAAFFRRARHRLNGLNRRRRTAAARPRSSRESSRST